MHSVQKLLLPPSSVNLQKIVGVACPNYLLLRSSYKPLMILISPVLFSVYCLSKFYLRSYLIIQEPHDCQTIDLGKTVELSVDLIFKVKSSDEKLQYKWCFDDEEIEEDDECRKVKECGVLSIQEFEKQFEGKYRCIISTTSKPIQSVSTEVQLQLTGKIATHIGSILIIIPFV